LETGPHAGKILSSVDHDRKSNGILAALASERDHAAGDPAGWLQRNGLAL
jgi:hypothetical protein